MELFDPPMPSSLRWVMPDSVRVVSPPMFDFGVALAENPLLAGFAPESWIVREVSVSRDSPLRVELIG